MAPSITGGAALKTAGLKNKISILAQEGSFPSLSLAQSNYYYQPDEAHQNMLISNIAVKGGATMNELPTVPQSAYVSLLGSQVFPSGIGLLSPPILSPKGGDQHLHATLQQDWSDNLRAVTPDVLVEDNECSDDEERKETEQLPFTKDMIDNSNPHRLQRILMSSEGYVSRRGELGILNFLPNVDDSDDMHGVDVEVSDVEKNVAQRSIRRSVVSKEKLNWSCQFQKGTFTAITTQGNKQITDMGNPKLFIDSNGAMHAINALKAKKKHYQLSDNPNLIDLNLSNKELKHLTVIMLSRNLKCIDLQSNKLESIPEELSQLIYLEKLKLDNNLLKKLPTNLRVLTNLNTLTFGHNQIRELPNGLEDLMKLESLMMNDNQISRLPLKMGQLIHLKRLFIHNNLITRLPVEIAKLGKLKEFSSEWLIYLNPPMPKIIRENKGQIIIDQIKHFCRTYQPQHLSNSQALEVQQRSFADFILYFHQIKAVDINKVQFGPKKRNLAHQVCTYNHLHLLQDLTTSKPKDLTSSSTVSHSLDLNARDQEGTTPICFAFRANFQEIVDYMIDLHPRVNLDIVAPKYGCPLHLCILKHRFGQALQLIETKQVNQNVLNPNGSNAMHILFANYQFDAQGISESLANKLVRKGINVNLVDSNGLTPIHVAIKKNQLKALEFALNHNNYSQQSSFSKFDFNAPGKKLFTPLHYAILKSNHDAFMFMMKNASQHLDLLQLDESFRTPRGLALINSPFFKILYKLEKVQLTKNNDGGASFEINLDGIVSLGKGLRNFNKTTGHKHHTRSFDFNNTYQFGSQHLDNLAHNLQFWFVVTDL